MTKITGLLSDWVGRSLWLYKFLVKVISISLTFDRVPSIWCNIMIILWLGLKVFSQLSPDNLDRVTKDPALFFFFWWKNHTHTWVFLWYVFMLYKCTCLCKNSWQKEREWERAKCQCLSFSICSTACLFFISVIRPAFILRCLCCHCCKL